MGGGEGWWEVGLGGWQLSSHAPVLPWVTAQQGAHPSMAQAPPLCSGHPAAPQAPGPWASYLSISMLAHRCPSAASAGIDDPPPHCSSPSTQGVSRGQSSGQNCSGSACPFRFCLPWPRGAPVCQGSVAGAVTHQPGVTGHSSHLWAQKGQSFLGRACSGPRQDFGLQISPREPGSSYWGRRLAPNLRVWGRPSWP